jgi:hypothetical protein
MKIFQGGTGVGIAPAWLLNHDRIAGTYVLLRTRLHVICLFTCHMLIIIGCLFGGLV